MTLLTLLCSLPSLRAQTFVVVLAFRTLTYNQDTDRRPQRTWRAVGGAHSSSYKSSPKSSGLLQAAPGEIGARERSLEQVNIGFLFPPAAPLSGAEDLSPKSYSSRPGTASKSAAPLGSTARTTTARRAQLFSPRLLRRSSSTSRPADDWLTPCSRTRSRWAFDTRASSSLSSSSEEASPSSSHSSALVEQ
eukprot:scaffold58318_cov73-Phaeocystis_antarctica.AAC.1